MSAGRGTDSIRNERGGVIVFVGLLMPVILLFIAFSVDIGNWWVHKRHLQLQVDAAALAGGALLGDCFDDPAAANTAIENEATRYGGGTGSTYNGQVGNANQGTIGALLYQSETFPSGASSIYPTNTGTPCEALQLDVKASETDLPLLFQLPGLSTVAAINAHARVELERVVVFKGSLPLAVPEVRPKRVTATVVDEAGSIVRFFELTGPNEVDTLNYWTGSGSVSVPKDGELGVRIGVGQVAGVCGAANGTGGAGYVCYDYSAFKKGAVSIAGYGSEGTLKDPKRAAFEVWPVTCAASPFFSETSLAGAPTCAASVRAKLHFPSGEVNPAVKTFKVTVTGASGFKVTENLNYDVANGYWRTPDFLIPVDGGLYEVELTFEASGSGTKSFSEPIQQFYSASDDAGPIKSVALSGALGSGGSSYALPAGSHTITVDVGLEGNLQLTPSDETVMLRLTGGSRSSAVECDGDGANEFRDAIINGCQTPYRINDAGICPNPVPPDPADCVETKTGAVAGPTLQALDERFASCPPYNWPTYELDDPRVVPLMITDFSALDGSGTTEVPVTNFATFYIAGWTDSTCGNNSAPPFDVKKGAIWGHFVKYAKPDPNAETDGPCVRTSVAPCVPVMTK